MKTENENAYSLRWRSAISLSLVVAVLVIAAMVYKAVHTEAVTIDIDGSFSLSANRLGSVIDLFPYVGSDIDVRFSDYEGMKYPEALQKLLEKRELPAGSRVKAVIRAEESAVNDHYGGAEETVKAAIEDAGLKPQCSKADEGIVSAAESCGISVGKYRLICEMQKLDSSISTDEYRDCPTETLRRMYELMRSGATKDNAEDSAGALKGGLPEIIKNILFESSKGE